MMKGVAVALLPLFLITGVLSARSTNPVFQPPANSYTEEQARQNPVADLAWWDLFKNPGLQALIREALDKNYDLQLAVAQVEQQRALLGVFSFHP